MAKDYTKYTIEGVAGNFGKSKLAYAIIENYISQNSVDFAILNAAFPDECQGGIHGVFRKKEDVKDFKRYYMHKPLKLIDGSNIVVSNQWGIDNIPGLITRATALGYTVKSVTITPSISTPELSLTDKTEIDIDVEIVIDGDSGFTKYANISLSVNSKLVADFNSKSDNLKCDYDTLYELIREITNNHTEEILMETHDQAGLDELLENNFDWFNLEPMIRVTEINDFNLSVLYENGFSQNFQAAAIFGVDDDEGEDIAMSFRDDTRFVVDRELLIKILK